MSELTNKEFLKRYTPVVDGPRRIDEMGEKKDEVKERLLNAETDLPSAVFNPASGYDCIEKAIAHIPVAIVDDRSGEGITVTSTFLDSFLTFSADTSYLVKLTYIKEGAGSSPEVVTVPLVGNLKCNNWGEAQGGIKQSISFSLPGKIVVDGQAQFNGVIPLQIERTYTSSTGTWDDWEMTSTVAAE